MSAEHTCTVPVGDEQLVAYWANDLDAATVDAIDDQLFTCAGCARDAERLSRVAQVFRMSLPPIVGREQVEALRASGLVVRDNDFEPSVRKTVHFARDVDFLIHHLRGLELRDAERVAVLIRSESTGSVLFDEPFAPFDVERGEVLIACQRHFSRMPSDIAVEVRVIRAASEHATTTYLIPHVFA